jgi:hypothetical protein
MERIVTSSGRREVWTLSTTKNSSNYGEECNFLWLVERCSVNILLQLKSGHFYNSVYLTFPRICIYNLQPSGTHRRCLEPSLPEVGDEARRERIPHDTNFSPFWVQ